MFGIIRAIIATVTEPINLPKLRKRYDWDAE